MAVNNNSSGISNNNSWDPNGINGINNGINNTAQSGHASVWDYFKNKFSGNLDWDRQNALQNKQNEFNAYMSATQAQRQVQDYEKAGLNPALLYGNQSAPPTSAVSSWNNKSSGINYGVDKNKYNEYRSNMHNSAYGFYKKEKSFINKIESDALLFLK